MAKHWYNALPEHKVIKEYTGTKVCINCGREYYSKSILQDSYRKEVDYDVCPYCSAINSVSREVLFYNRRK